MVEENSVIYIRHAESKYNLWYKFIQNRLTETERTSNFAEILEVSQYKDKRDFKMWDSPLSKNGISECLKYAEIYSKMPIKVVYVSCLRRALQTAKLLFMFHPNKPKIIVHPLIREIMNLPNDIPGPLNQTISEYKDFDFSLLSKYEIPELHFVYTLNSPDRENLFKYIDESGGIKEYLQGIENYKTYKKLVNPKHYHRIEGFEYVRKRAIDFRNYLRNYCEQEKIRPCEIAVVTHGAFIGYTMATKFNEWHKADFKPIPNCSYINVNI